MYNFIGKNKIIWKYLLPLKYTLPVYLRMKHRMKRHITVPIALLIYLAAMAYFTHPARHSGGGAGFVRYYITIGVSIAIIIALSYFLKRKEENKKKHKTTGKTE